jgi:hypothetical protein
MNGEDESSERPDAVEKVADVLARLLLADYWTEAKPMVGSPRGKMTVGSRSAERSSSCSIRPTKKPRKITYPNGTRQFDRSASPNSPLAKRKVGAADGSNWDSTTIA